MENRLNEATLLSLVERISGLEIRAAVADLDAGFIGLALARLRLLDFRIYELTLVKATFAVAL